MIFPPAWAPWAPSYAIALLKSAAGARGHSINTFDLNIDLHNAVSQDDQMFWRDEHVLFWESDASVATLVSRYEPFLDSYVDRMMLGGASLYACSVNSASHRFAHRIAEKIKKRDPAAFMLFGGPACFRSETGLEILRYSSVDAVCTGEGDSAWPEFLDVFEKNGYRLNGQDIKGFSIRTGGSIIDYGDPEISMDLDHLPYADYSSVDFSKYTLSNRVCLMMSRGCINRCTYCSEGPNFLQYRYRSPENLYVEVKRQVHLLQSASGQTPHINFSDSIINGKPEILKAFCYRVIQEGLRFTWGGMALLRKEMTSEFLADMQKAGCIEICWGLESGSQTILDLMRKKHFTPTLAEEIFRTAHSLGIQQYTNIIVGFPGETEQLFLETAQFLLRIKPYFRSIGLPLLSLRKNSCLYNNYRQYGIESLDTEKWRTVDGSNTYEMRVTRRNLLQNILAEKVFDQGRYG
jgi:anaerobic magnesium-protoporphyrin IX monomethyl ester cyclase